MKGAQRDFPLSSLALETYDYFAAISPPSLVNNSFMVTVSGSLAAVVISCGSTSGFEFFGQPAIIEFSSRPEIRDYIGQIRRRVSRQIRDSAPAGLANAVSYTMPLMPHLDEFARGLLDAGWLPSVEFEGVIELNKDVTLLEKNLRENAMRDVRKAEKALGPPQIHHEKISDESFSEFRQLHLVSAGRVTRSIDSWHEMLAALRRGNASLVTVRHDDELVGGTFCWVSKSAALYGSGAYKRELFSQFPISHLTLFHSILLAEHLGCEKFFVGQTYAPGGTDKEKAIAFFKRGFSERIQPKLVLRTL
ncbi:hypothetical protein GM51_2945 [freshwater metagenome]|uniref:BioF2-like acetyltransferase domain-containing protein n=1 Tax=freshwater metagenome TaxID=449393 RepID=A0A094R2N6_9ZZZZ